MLNHTGGTIRRVAAVYNRFTYSDERKATVDALGRFVITLVHPEMAAGKVVTLRG